MKVLLTFLYLIITLHLQSQIVNANDATGAPIRTSSYDKVEGSPYLNDGNWSSGTIVTQTDQYLSNLKIRYNAYEDELQYLNKGNPFYYENQDVKSFEYSIVDQLGNTERFYFKNGFEHSNKIEKKNFIRVLYDGKFVKALDKIESRKQMVTPAAYGESDYEKFITINNTYVWLNGEIIELGFKKGKLLKLFSSLKGKIQSYLKENIVDFNNSKDISGLFQFIDRELEDIDS
ncbi:hypothetical protein [Ekhidna sp.]|uniref:hypothetical protein n=1 Tax=Ekhidna sp. TaxID=2608089 RepID=UPI003298CEF3